MFAAAPRPAVSASSAGARAGRGGGDDLPTQPHLAPPAPDPGRRQPGHARPPGSSPLAGAALPSRMSQEGKENEMDTPLVVAPEEWLAARKDLLAREKEVTRTKDAADAARRALP